MLFHNNEPVFTYAGEQQQDWRFQRELDAEPETTNTCFDCGHSWRTPKAKKAALDRDGIYNRAMTLKEAKRNAEALAAFQEILEQDPNDRDALFGCFSACMHMGEGPASAVYLRQWSLGAE